jgi:hypothetical protein
MEANPSISHFERGRPGGGSVVEVEVEVVVVE